MTTKGILRLASVGFAGYFVGKLIEKGTNLISGGVKTYPGLPLYGSVSVVTPFSSESSSVSIQEVIPDKKSRMGEMIKYGYPQMDHVRIRDDYVLAYDRRNRVAFWAFEHLTPESVKENNQVDRKNSEFIEDLSIHEYFRSKNSDYRGSGFDRGHLACAANHRISQRYMDQTFLLSNMCPQVGVGFNRDAWFHLEDHVRTLTKTYPHVYVCSGPLYLPREETDGKMYIKYRVIGASHVAVPTHFFKIIVMELPNRKLHMEAYVMPNQKIEENTPLKAFMVPPETIERASGLLFLDKISKSNLVQINGTKPT